MGTKSYIKDYPRPQMVRDDFELLNGSWDFAFDDENRGEEKGWNAGFDSDLVIQVPFTYETKLSGICDETRHDHVWYQRKITLEKAEDKQYILHLEGSDYLTKVWVNGSLIGSHEGAYERASYDMTNALKTGVNRIVIGVSDSFSISQPRGKQRWINNNFGCWYVQTTGIWKTVWMEAVPKVHFDELKITPDIDEGAVEITAAIKGIVGCADAGICGAPADKEGTNDKADLSLYGEISFDGKTVKTFCENIHKNLTELKVDIRDYELTEWGLKLWDTYDPNLYDMTLEIRRGDECVDKIGSYFGMRKVSIENGEVLLNNRPIYQKLILDQGYFADSHLTPPSEDALIEDIDKIHQLGFNGLRKHMKIEDERFLYHCDVKGMLVWSEMAACYEFTDEAVRKFTDEWVQIVKQNYSHPCIITWTPFNESWGVPQIARNEKQKKFTEAIYNLTKSIDNTRPVIVNDGWEHTVSDLLTLHDYEEDGDVFKKRYVDYKDEILNGTYCHNRANLAIVEGYDYKGQPVIISEYGGIAFSSKDDDQWGYGNCVSDEEAFLKRYKKITHAIMSIPYIKGFCYTQVSDVQQEVNGLMTIDRKFKVNPDKIREINRGIGL
ncbi:glycoside hydrolase family 2 protein [Butyrivibrio sp. AE3006]|uniref:glycoside hydrolase family 2 protein n=1 Tax=Butyrivibrio sp. AE3006 TaxID=1280673 RepID=UPI0004288C0C|nr:glycoside hydrolase family 2 [Butyrivibrio sp. AE3006]